MKIVSVVGARPQFVKAAVLSRKIGSLDSIKEVLVHTGQHFDENMSRVFFDELSIPSPDYNLEVGGGEHGQMTGRQLEKIEIVLLKEKPDWVVVYGDTNSTLAGALAAAKLNIPLAHIEAGLRSYNKSMPEEVNRVLVDHISNKLFAPTESAVANLEREGISGACQIGDIMHDAAIYYQPKALEPEWFSRAGLEIDDFVLVTVHRAETTDNRDKLQSVFEGLQMFGSKVVLPLHPRTRQRLDEWQISLGENLVVVEPVGYLEMVWLLRGCKVVATDSGGVQKEAFFHGKPCVTLRDETEWTELVQCGWNRLTGSNAQAIARALTDISVPDTRPRLYGSGDAASKIINELMN